MEDKLFNEFKFDTGWKILKNINFFEKEYIIRVKMDSYYKEDLITQEQKEKYLAYLKDEKNILKTIENMLEKYSEKASVRFTPKTLLFERDGSYALLCDDSEALDEGIAVCIFPEKKIVSQDEYL